MTAPRATTPVARTARVIHAAMISGVLLFAIVSHVVMRPTMTNSGPFPPVVINVLLGSAIGACVLSLILRRRVRQRGGSESPDLFWAAATTPAVLTWTCLEGSGITAVLVYALTGSASAIAVAVVAMLLLVVMNPAHLERR